MAANHSKGSCRIWVAALAAAVLASLLVSPHARSEDVEGTRAPLQRKRASLIRNTLAKALVLDKTGMCLELGKIPCADVAHRVSLGGMDAYARSQYRYPEEITITSPVALERLVLSACIQRAQMDLINPVSAVIFKDIELASDGRLIQSDSIGEAINRLYQRAFTRNATDNEVNELKQLYVRIYEEEPVGAARNWMVLTCFAVLSSVESAFY